MTNLDKLKIQQHLNIYNYDNLTIYNVYSQIKEEVKKASYKNSEVFCEIQANKYSRFGIRVYVLNTRHFEIL